MSHTPGGHTSITLIQEARSVPFTLTMTLLPFIPLYCYWNMDFLVPYPTIKTKKSTFSLKSDLCGVAFAWHRAISKSTFICLHQNSHLGGFVCRAGMVRSEPSKDSECGWRLSTAASRGGVSLLLCWEVTLCTTWLISGTQQTYPCYWLYTAQQIIRLVPIMREIIKASGF